MKKLIILLFLIPVFCQAQVAKDKVYHTTVGSVLTTACYTPYYIDEFDFGTSTRLSFAVVLMAANGKEMYDAFNGGRFSYEDVGYTMGGWLVTVGLNYGIHKIRVKKKKRLELKKKSLVEF